MQVGDLHPVLDVVRQAWTQLGPAAVTLLRVTLIVLAAWALLMMVQRAIRVFRERVSARLDDREAVQRAETLGRVGRYLAAVVVTLITGMLVLGEVGISVAPILGAAGVVGLAVGFGAQSLVRDYFTGFFLLLENQIRQGDVVQLGPHAGQVEEVTLRYVRLRDYDGHVHFVPNGQISTVVNMSRGFAYAVVDVGVASRANVDQAMAAMAGVGRSLRADEAFANRIVDDLEIAGVERWADAVLVIRCRFRCRPLEQWNVRREFLRRLKAAFDDQGIEAPFPHVTVYPAPGASAMVPGWPPQGRAGSTGS